MKTFDCDFPPLCHREEDNLFPPIQDQMNLFQMHNEKDIASLK